MTTTESYHRLLAQHVIETIGQHNLTGTYCETKEDALTHALSLIPEDGSVSCGGSVTLQALGLRPALKEGGFRFLDPRAGETAADKARIAVEAMSADCYFMSANAIAESGEIVNADGIGNRVAALAYGPKRVVLIAGINKVVPTLEAAIQRVETTAARQAVLAYQPDAASFDALSTAAHASISHLVITRQSVFPGRIHLILVGEDLGY